MFLSITMRYGLKTFELSGSPFSPGRILMYVNNEEIVFIKIDIYVKKAKTNIQKKGKMQKKSPNKGHLIDWLKKALNEHSFKGLRWDSKETNTFYVVWTHKSAEQWSKTDLEPFEAWAIYKGKREGKNEKQLKATFRCALNSKKDLLKEIKNRRNRNRRYWQFLDVDPEAPEKGNSIKKKGKDNNEYAKDTPIPAKNTYINGTSSIKINSSHEAEYVASCPLPNFESFCSFATLTPPHQPNEVAYNFSESELSQQDSSSKENCATNCNIERISPNGVNNGFSKSPSPVGNFIEAECPRTSKLPPFETFCSFASLTPPPQLNEIFFISSECRSICTPSPDHNKQNPPRKDFYSRPNADMWQPNCWATPLAGENFNTFSQFFSDDFEDMMYNCTIQETNHNRVEILEMDQFVPVMDTSHNIQVANSRNGQYSCTNKTTFETPALQDQMKLDEDYLLRDDVDPEACVKLIQEIEQADPTIRNRTTQLLQLNSFANFSMT